jgi:hypothetical protein
MITIDPVKPRSDYRHYSNPDCQGSLIKATSKWPMSKSETRCGGGSIYENAFNRDYNAFVKFNENKKDKPITVPAGLDIFSAYLDRMEGAKLDLAWKRLSNGLDSPDDELITFAKEYFEEDIVAVRTVYYYNLSSGYDCPRIDLIFRRKS